MGRREFILCSKFPIANSDPKISLRIQTRIQSKSISTQNNMDVTLFLVFSTRDTSFEPNLWQRIQSNIKQGQTVHILQLFGIYIPLARLYIYIYIFI